MSEHDHDNYKTALDAWTAEILKRQEAERDRDEAFKLVEDGIEVAKRCAALWAENGKLRDYILQVERERDEAWEKINLLEARVKDLYWTENEIWRVVGPDDFKKRKARVQKYELEEP